MPYVITHTNGTTICTVQDTTIDTTNSPLTLIGKQYDGYGQALNNNLIRLLENFANTTPPLPNYLGQLWFNSTTNTLGIIDNPLSPGTWSNIATQTWTNNNYLPTTNPGGANLWFGPSNEYRFSWTVDRNVALYIFNSLGIAVPIWSTGTIVSDASLKKNISDYTDGLSVVNDLRVVSFEWTEDSGLNDSKTHVGLLAQDVEKIVPNAVHDIVGEDKPTKILHKEELVPHLIKAVQQLSSENTELKKMFKELQEEFAVLKSAKYNKRKPNSLA